MGDKRIKNPGVGTGNAPGSRLTQFKKGQVNNPAGRPKGHKALAKALRDELKDEGPVALAQYAFRVWRGEEPGVTTHAQRWEAFCWIKDNAYGKTPLEINLNNGPETVNILVPDMSSLTDDELRMIQEAESIALRAANAIDV